MSEIGKLEVNTLLRMENNLSLVRVFVRDHKTERTRHLYENCEI